MKTLLHPLAVVLAFLTLACLTFNARGASVGPAGYSADFSTRPAATDWSTRSITGGAGGAADAVNSSQVDTNLSFIAASSITNQVLDLSPLDPAGTNALASWTSAGGAYLQTRPAGVRMTLLMATLINNTGSNVDTLNISYALTLATTVAEEVPGQRVYSSLTGAAGSWVNIAAPSASGRVNATVNATWLAGASLYILIVDDNGSGTPDSACQIDNFTVTTGGGVPATTAIVISSPTDGQNIVEGAAFAVTTTTSGAITDAGFYLDGGFVGSDSTLPFSVTLSNAAPGAHMLTAVANSSIASTPVHITIVANNPPTTTLTTVPGGTVLVGSNIINTAVVTDTDPGGSIARVEFYLDGTLKVTDTISPYTYEYCDSTAGTHTIQAVAVDHLDARGTNGNTLIVTNPADVTVIIPNGSGWKSFDRGIDQGTTWRQLLFDDTGWSNGVAELGYGDAAGNRPETTVVGFGSSSAAKYPTTYFRKTFNVANASAYTNLIVRLLRDDGGIVYINDTEVFRSYMTNGTVTYATFAGLAGAGPATTDDGTFYQTTTVSPSVLVNGPNIVAVEIHQEATGSSDISFDLMLWGQGAVDPALTITRTDDTHADVKWPFPSTGYVLKSKTDLNGATWDLVTELDVPDASFHHVRIDTSSGQRFLRLQGP